ncbi:MAG: FprA family A-type flavoprotein [Bacillota bacterium]
MGTIKTLKLQDDLHWAGILDKELRVFDIIMHTEFGTTYNSYVLNCGDKTVLFETAKAKFSKDYEDALTELMGSDKKIDYVVVNHTEPDHAGSLAMIIEKCPEVQVIATPVAIGFLKEIVNKPFNAVPVKNAQEMEIGNKTLRFYSLPNLHWPDSMYTYIVENKTLVTCDSFGSHYAHDGILKSTVTDQEGYMRATKYYFDNILGPFANPFMANALKVVDSLDIDMICTGHGPVLDADIDSLVATYKEWCTPATKNEVPTVAIPYVSAYGYTGELAEKIAEGISSVGTIKAETFDLVTEDYDTVLGKTIAADGVLLGSPTILNDALTPIWNLTISLFPVHCQGKPGGAFGSFGWSGEAVPMLTERMKQLKFDVVDGFKVKFKPSDDQLQAAFEFGQAFGKKVLEKQK